MSLCVKVSFRSFEVSGQNSFRCKRRKVYERYKASVSTHRGTDRSFVVFITQKLHISFLQYTISSVTQAE